MDDKDTQEASSGAVDSASKGDTAPPTAVDSTRPVVQETGSLATISQSDTTAGNAASTRPISSHDTRGAVDDDGGADNNSEAETIIASKNGTPVKPRKAIRHDAGSADSARVSSRLEALTEESSTAQSAKKSERSDANYNDTEKFASSETTVPVVKIPFVEDAPMQDVASSSNIPAVAESSRQRESTSRASSNALGSEIIRTKSPSISKGKDREDVRPRDKAKTQDKDNGVSVKRKASKPASDDDSEAHRVRRRRVSGSIDAGITHRSRELKGASEGSLRNRSASPPSRHRRRSMSTQLSSHSISGLGHNKKRVPASLHFEHGSDEASDDSTAPPRSSKLRSLDAQGHTETHMSPAKQGPDKRPVDGHGQTLLARACARGDYNKVKERLNKRPQDLNHPDYAGNAPLQIAALNGRERIVKLLVEAGCNIDCINNDKDTPLLDAVDNGHVEVVRVLLEAGVNPRKANVNGEEPSDRVRDDTDNAQEIQALLQRAKDAPSGRQQTSEERHDTHGMNSPHSAAESSHAAMESIPAPRRVTTSRSLKTSNQALHQHLDVNALRHAAKTGDKATVSRILNLHDKFDDPESLVAAARGGHDTAMEYLLAIGGANPDPKPIVGVAREHGTPMLAAIGKENIKVVRLLLDQADFDPTRRFRGESYYEIARSRQGTNWKEEEHMLKQAYDAYKKSHKADPVHKSPSRGGKHEGKESHRGRVTSPTKHRKSSQSVKTGGDAHTKGDSKNESAPHPRNEATSPKRGPGRPRKITTDEMMDPGQSSTKAKQQIRRVESDVAVHSSDGENIKPARRKLVSGKDLKGTRERMHRASIASDTSSLRAPTSPTDSRDGDGTNRLHTKPSTDRALNSKRDDVSKDRASVSREPSTKRHRVSTSPTRNSRKETEGPSKRRKTGADGDRQRSSSASTSPEARQRKPSISPDVNQQLASGGVAESKPVNHVRSKSHERIAVSMPSAEDDALVSVKLQKKAKAEVHHDDVDMPDADVTVVKKEMPSTIETTMEQSRKAEAKAEHEAARRESELAIEARTLRIEQEARQRRAEEDRKQRELEKAERAQREAEAQQKKKAEVEKEMAAQIRRREEEARREEQEAEEKRRREAEEAQEQLLLQQKEKERLGQEQIQREAMEAARRKREEEEREQRRAARIAEMRALHEEEERVRLSKLPPLIQWLDRSGSAVKTAEIANLFRVMQGVRDDTIRPQFTGQAQGREQWVLNTQVALLLGESDLSLAKFTGWERIPVSMVAKKTIWAVEKDRYALTDWFLRASIGRSLPEYYNGKDAREIDNFDMISLRKAAWLQFAALDMFFVKITDLMFTVSNTPHLRSIRLVVHYREVPEHESHLTQPVLLNQRWKSDPGSERFGRWPPLYKWYVDGQLVEESQPKSYKPSRTPPPFVRVPRLGLTAVDPDHPQYARLCKEQGLEHLLLPQQPIQLAGDETPAITAAPATTAPLTNGHTSVAILSNGTRGLHNGEAHERPAL